MSKKCRHKKNKPQNIQNTITALVSESEQSTKENGEQSVETSDSTEQISSFVKIKEDLDEAHLDTKNDTEKSDEHSDNLFDEEIHDESFGINRGTKQVLTYVITALICVSVIGLSYLLTLHMPGSEDVIAAHADELRKQDDMSSLQETHDSLSYDVDQLKTSADSKKNKIDNINDYDNTKAELRTQIESKKSELNELSNQYSQKQADLEGINNSIEQRSASTITLPAGKYSVGTNIPAGKYSVSGSGQFTAASSDGTSKANTSLNSDTYEITLESGDIIKIDSKTKFVPIG